MILKNVDLRIQVEDILYELFIKDECSQHMEFDEFEEYCIKNKKWNTDTERFKAYSKIWGLQDFTRGKTYNAAYDALLDYFRKTENKFEGVIQRFGLYKDRDQKFIHFPKTEENLSVVVEITCNDRWSRNGRILFNKRFPRKVQLHCRLCPYEGAPEDAIYMVFQNPEDFNKYIYHKKRGAWEDKVDKYYVHA